MLAYSGGLDTSVALRWLAEEYGAEVIALLVDVGQGVDREAVTERALAAGATDVVVAASVAGTGVVAAVVAEAVSTGATVVADEKISLSLLLHAARNPPVATSPVAASPRRRKVLREARSKYGRSMSWALLTTKVGAR